MGFQLSPGVNVSEIDLTTVVPSVLTTAGAFAGTFRWGPANKVVLVDSEITLSKTFGTPDDDSAISFFTAANFLSYGNNLSVVRAVGSNARNALVNTQQVLRIDNSDDFQYTYLNANTENMYGSFAARYPGSIGNSLSVQVIDSGCDFESWTYSSYFPSAPGTSDQCSSLGGSDDELHIVVIDFQGKITGTQGKVLETFPFVSKAIDSTYNGESNYYKQTIFNKSKYVYALDPVLYSNTHSTWGRSGSTSFATIADPIEAILGGGVDSVPSAANTNTAFSHFVNKETTNISLVLTGNPDTTVQQYVIDNIVNQRQDCVAFISPPSLATVNNSGSEVASIKSWLSSLSRSSSYVVADCGWKYQFDVYNNVYRWIPLNADIAGLCVNTDNVRDPWYSPAGFSRGAVKNAIKLAWNPNKTERDLLYSVGVNPVVSFPGQGVVLFGDKTLQSKPSAFDRINVRRLFIVLEKAIGLASKYQLFEFNDDFTRAQFKAIVEPFLRDVQGKRGITDFRVKCDSGNNTGDVVDRNEFVADIYIKPARSINYITLSFIATRTGIDFSTLGA